MSLLDCLRQIIIKHRRHHRRHHHNHHRPEVAGLAFMSKGRRLESKMDLRVDQNLPLSVVAVDKYGNSLGPVAAFDSAPSWGISDASFGALNVDPSGVLAMLVPAGKLGQANLSLSGQLGGKALSAAPLAINFIAGSAAGIAIQPGTPVNQ